MRARDGDAPAPARTPDPESRVSEQTSSAAIPAPSPRAVGGGAADHTSKALAKGLAREIATGIGDRRIRAEVRTRSYNQLVALLQGFDTRLAAEHARRRRLLTGAAGIIAVLGAVLGGSLLF